MIKLTEIKSLLKVSDQDLAKLDTEKLRTLLGSSRYFTRQIEREINKRFTANPFGTVQGDTYGQQQ